MRDIDSDVADLPDSQLDRFLLLISANSLELIFQEFVQCTCEWMQASRCALWWLDANHVGFRLVSVSGEESKTTDSDATFLPYGTASNLGLLSSQDITELHEDSAPNLHGFELAYSLATSIHYEDRTSGILIVFPHERPYSWPASTRNRLRTIARHGAVISSCMTG
jgi:hypothetical protein